MSVRLTKKRENKRKKKNSWALFSFSAGVLEIRKLLKSRTAVKCGSVLETNGNKQLFHSGLFCLFASGSLEKKQILVEARNLFVVSLVCFWEHFR